MSGDPDAIVVGSGLAGLAAARSLRRAGHRVLVLEGAPEAGGRVRDETWEGARLAIGAQFLTGSYRALLAQLDEVGLARELTPLQRGYGAAVRRDGRWYETDYGSRRSFATFAAIGWRDRTSVAVGMARALLRAAGLDFGDLTSVPSLSGRRVTETFTDAAAHFFLCAPYEILMGYRPDEVSVALLAVGALHRAGPLTLGDGLSELPRRLAARLDVAFGEEVTRVVESDGGVVVEARGPAGTLSRRARCAIVATPAHDAARLWRDAPVATRDFLASVPYSRTDWAYLRTRRPCSPSGRSGRPLSMYLVPPRERGARETLAYLGFMDARAVSGGGLLLAAAGNDTGADQLDDEELGALLQRDAEAIHPDLRGEVVARRTVRWESYVPVFSPDYARRLRTARDALRPAAIDLAGDYLYAPWMEGAVQAGEAAAERAARYLRGAAGRSLPA